MITPLILTDAQFSALRKAIKTSNIKEYEVTSVFRYKNGTIYYCCRFDTNFVYYCLDLEGNCTMLAERPDIRYLTKLNILPNPYHFW